MKNTRGIPKSAEKGLQAIPAHSRPRHGAIGFQVNLLFPVVVALNSYLFVRLILIDKLTAILTVREKFYNLQPFTIMVGGTGGGLSRLTPCSYNQTPSAVP